MIQDIQANGGWATTWDTTNLVHNYHYIIEVRSFDGFQYSEAASIEIIIDNPPNQDNTRPTFNSTAWPDSATIFCEETGASQNRCGNGYSIDLTQFFSDVDAGDSLSYYVLDQQDKFEDDYHAEVITVGSSGVANYNPLSMSFYFPDMEDWSLEAVIFQVRDSAGSTISSDPLDFDVVGVSFTSECDGILIGGEEFVSGCDGQISQSDTLIYRGNGRPTVSVIGETGAGLRLGSTAVGEDGTWMMEIPGNRLDKGSNTVVFEYGSIGQPLNEDSDIVVEGGLDEGSGILKWIGLTVLGLIVLGILGAVFVFFFVEFEDEFDEGIDDLVEEEVDPYAWAKERQQQDAAAAETQQVAQPAVQEAATPAVSGYPGWKWDAEQNKWIPDNE